VDKQKNKGGAGLNKKYLTDDQIGQLEKLAQVMSKKFIADLFGISRNTFDRILDENPELFELYKKGKAKTMQKAGRTLIQKAFGDPDLNIPPDTACLIFYLKTQGEGDWKEAAKELNVNHTGETTQKTITIVKSEVDEEIIKDG
jgi:hypothetical protein